MGRQLRADEGVAGIPTVAAEWMCRQAAGVGPSSVRTPLLRAARAFRQGGDLGRVLIWMLIAGAFAYVPGEYLFAWVLDPEDPSKHKAREALTVFACIVVALGVAISNAWQIHHKRDPLQLGVPRKWNPWITSFVGAAVGWLAGTTVFR